MPGFLGTERQFAARYGKPILASRDAKSSSREQEAGVIFGSRCLLIVGPQTSPFSSNFYALY